MPQLDKLAFFSQIVVFIFFIFFIFIFISTILLPRIFQIKRLRYLYLLNTKNFELNDVKGNILFYYFLYNLNIVNSIFFIFLSSYESHNYYDYSFNFNNIVDEFFLDVDIIFLDYFFENFVIDFEI
jgi:hypothetical protein